MPPQSGTHLTTKRTRGDNTWELEQEDSVSLFSLSWECVLLQTQLLHGFGCEYKGNMGIDLGLQIDMSS